MIDLFEKLQELTYNQTKAIEAQDTDLLTLINKDKQKLIDKINSLPQGRRYAGLTQPQIKKITALIEEQLSLHETNEKKLRSLIGKLKNELSEVSKGKAAAKGYSGQDVSGPRFFDAAG